MADSKVRIIIDVDYDGREVRIAERDMDKLADSTERSAQSSRSMGEKLAIATAAIATAGLAARELYQIMGEGAQIQTTANKFDALSESIGITSGALLGDMREATRGFISDTELMRGANELINVGIAGNAEEVRRFSSVIGGLGLDMQQLTLTIVNQSKMRLDALGLSVEDVDAKYQQLRETLPDEEAWKIAVLESLEDKMGLLGDTVSDSDAVMQEFNTKIQNMGDSAKAATAEGLTPLVNELNRLFDIDPETDVGWGARIVEGIAAPLTDFIGITADIRQAFGNMFDDSVWENPDLGLVERFIDSMAVAAGLEPQFMKAEEAQAAWTMTTEQHTWALEQWSRAGREATDTTDRHSGSIDHLNSVTAAWGETHARANEHVEAAIHFQRQAAEAHERYAARIDEFNREAGAQFAEQVQRGADALYNVGEASGVAQPNADAIAQALFDQAAAAGASAPALAALGVATGLMSDEQAEAFLKAAALQIKIDELGELIAQDKIGIPEALDEIKAFQDELAGVDGSGRGAAEAMGLVKSNALELNGTVIDITTRYHTEGTPPWQQARQESRAGGGTGGAGQGSEAGGATGAGDFAVGTSFFPGGLTNIHERGPELVSLPRGAMINNAPKTAQMMMKGQLGGGDTHYHFHAGGPSAGMEQEFAMLQAAAGIE